MILTRWKLMAGVLAVSLGGLAAMAGQCTKSEPTKGGTPPEMPAASAPATKPAAAPSPMMTPPAAPMLPSIPAAEPAKPVELPPPPAVLPVGGTTPSVPPVPNTDYTPVEATAGGRSPASPGGYEKPAPAPPMPTELTPIPAGSALPTPPTLTPPASAPTPPMSLPSDPLIDATPPSPSNFIKPAATAPTSAAVAAVQAKYRILLRVGEGEPLFEVRSADHLILKVVCEKVDVKSPEKGQGLSAVKAAGKVRFAGFGAEGTCDELHFLAGTGEVSMTGNVKIQVKDKLGRIESELSADTMRYRLDPQTLTGNGLLKP